MDRRTFLKNSTATGGAWLPRGRWAIRARRREGHHETRSSSSWTNSKRRIGRADRPNRHVSSRVTLSLRLREHIWQHGNQASSRT